MRKPFKGCNGLFSFVLNKKLTQEELEAYLDNFEHFSMAYSWGGYESLILANQPEELNAIRPANPVDFEGTLVRIHIGLENVSDLIEDLENGFKRATMKFVADDVTGQAQQIFRNISAVLAEAGSEKNRVVKTTVFLSDMNNFAEFNTAYAEFFGEHKPARSCVEVARLPLDALVEIELIAEL